MPRRRPRFRPPGFKPWTRIGALGPFRGRLGLAWVVAPLVLGVVLLVFGWLLVFRSHPPGGTFVPVGTLSSIAPGVRTTALPDGRMVSYGRTDSGFFAHVRGAPCDLLPVAVYGGRLYVDPSHPTPCPSPSDLTRAPPTVSSGMRG